MRAGNLDRRITIQTVGTIVDDYGREVPGGTVDLATVWASMQQQGGREFIAADAVQAERKVVFRLHYVSGLDEAMTVLHDGMEYDIREVRELGRRQGLELHCTSTT